MKKMIPMMKLCTKSEETSRVMVVWEILTSYAVIRRMGDVKSKIFVAPNRKECQ